MELKRLRDSAKRASMVPLIHAGTTRYVDDVRVGDELEVTKPNEPDFRKTGRVRVHHLGEPRHLIIVLDDAEGLGARKGKAKKKHKKKKVRTTEWRFEYNDDSQWNCYTCKLIGEDANAEWETCSDDSGDAELIDENHPWLAPPPISSEGFLAGLQKGDPFYTSILYGPVLPTDISRNVDAKVKSSEDNEEAETKDDTNDGVGLTKESSDASWPERPLNHRLNLPLYHTFLDDLGKRIVLEVRTLVTARGHGNTKCWAFKFCVNPTRPLIELLREVYIMAANEHYEPLLRLVPHEPMLSRNCRENKVYVDGALVTIVDGTNASRGLRHGSVLGVHPDWHADCFQCDLWMRSWLEGRVPNDMSESLQFWGELVLEVMEQCEEQLNRRKGTFVMELSPPGWNVPPVNEAIASNPEENKTSAEGLDAPVDVLYAKGHEESKTSDDGCTSQDADDNLEHVDTETMTAERHEGNKTPADGRDALPLTTWSLHDKKRKQRGASHTTSLEENRTSADGHDARYVDDTHEHADTEKAVAEGTEGNENPADMHEAPLLAVRSLLVSPEVKDDDETNEQRDDDEANEQRDGDEANEQEQRDDDEMMTTKQMMGTLQEQRDDDEANEQRDGDEANEQEQRDGDEMMTTRQMMGTLQEQRDDDEANEQRDDTQTTRYSRWKGTTRKLRVLLLRHGQEETYRKLSELNMNDEMIDEITMEVALEARREKRAEAKRARRETASEMLIETIDEMVRITVDDEVRRQDERERVIRQGLSVFYRTGVQVREIDRGCEQGGRNVADETGGSAAHGDSGRCGRGCKGDGRGVEGGMRLVRWRDVGADVNDKTRGNRGWRPGARGAGGQNLERGGRGFMYHLRLGDAGRAMRERG